MPLRAQRWGLQITRYTAERNETDLWAWRPRSASGYVSTFGTLEGLAGIQPARPVEARFSEIVRLQFRDSEARGEYAKPHDWHFAFELSGRAHPTQGTTLDIALNPDFGLVEADQVVLNLSNYEIFYPEKRPLFLEGQDTWVTPRSVLYTRRIGAQPGDPTLAPGERLLDHPDPSRIWAAAKLVGAAGSRTNVGLITALTGENTAQIETQTRDPGIFGADAFTVSRVVAPPSLFNVLRLRRLWGQGGDVGLLATAVNRFEHAATPRLTNDAYVAAADGHWHSPAANYLLTGQLVAAMLAEGPSRPQADGIATEPGHVALGGTLTAAKQGGEHWLASTSHSISGRELDYNDLGYLDRKNDYSGYADLTYRTVAPWWKTTDTFATAAASHRQTLDGISLGDNFRLMVGGTLTSFWSTNVAAYYHS
jgi:hypothetical protein